MDKRRLPQQLDVLLHALCQVRERQPLDVQPLALLIRCLAQLLLDSL